MSVTQVILPFQLAEDASKSGLTAFAGLPLVIETFRAFGLGKKTNRLVHVRARKRGFTEAEMVETITALMAAGGDCVDDVRMLASDPGLLRLWRLKRIPSASAVRRFLDGFHDDAMALSEVGKASVPEPTAPLRGLGRVNRQFVRQIPFARPLAFVLRPAGALRHLLQELSGLVEHQHTVVAVAVGHDDVAAVQHGDARRQIEMRRIGALHLRRAKLQ